MTRKSQLSTVHEVIEAFGGLQAMCEIFGGGPSKFCNHKAAGKFPERMHHRLYREAIKRRLNIDDKLLGGEEPEPQGQLALQAAE